MGIKTVAVYSDADARALHVEMADEAVHIGPPAAESPIWSSTRSSRPASRPARMPCIPVMGSCRERASFANALDAGITFIGPNPNVPSRRWATRSTSKKVAPKPRRFTVPGYLG
jgi:propionyl-CoA carboxylase alpha chain